jgi:hypothetical protein
MSVPQHTNNRVPFCQKVRGCRFPFQKSYVPKKYCTAVTCGPRMECPIVILFGRVSQKSNKRSNAQNHHKGDKKGRPKRRQKTARKIQKKGES